MPFWPVNQSMPLPSNVAVLGLAWWGSGEAVWGGDAEHGGSVERRGVGVGVAALAGQGIALDGRGLRIDAEDRVGPAVGDPRRAVRSDDHAVRGRAFAERNMRRLAGFRIKPPQRALALRGVPDRPARRGIGCDVVRM